MNNKYNPYQDITKTIIEQLKSGTIPWRQTFSSASFGLPKNYFSGHSYRGINLLLLGMLDYEHPLYLSFLQCKKLGGRIRQGAKTHRVYFSSFIYSDASGKRIKQEQYEALEKAGIKGIKKYFFLRYYKLFNICDVEGITLDLPKVQTFEHTRDIRCESLIESLQPDLKLGHSNSREAFYLPSIDQVNIPELKYFYSADQYYATLFHELGHWSGHPNRLNRNFAQFGTKTYSKEELIAELTACFLCANCNIFNDPLKDNSAAYIQSWIKVLNNDYQFIYQAAQNAQKATHFILDYKKHINYYSS
ncbi:MAG: zincin-like metallopeptidase domain-containing protein [Bacteroidota bacterium]